MVNWADQNSKIYKTIEERKQVNRERQIDFKERRTLYLRQLESDIGHKSQKLKELQTTHDKMSDDYLMLRYRCSFLERILLEKGKRSYLNGSSNSH